MFTKVQNRYNEQVAYVVAINESLKIAELEFEDAPGEQHKFVSLEQLYKNWVDLNSTSEKHDKPRGRKPLTKEQKEASKNKRAQEELKDNREALFNYVHTRALEHGMEYYTLKVDTSPKSHNSRLTYKYKLPESSMVQMIMYVNSKGIELALRSALLGYPLSNSDNFIHLNHYYNRRLRVKSFTPYIQEFIDKIIEALTKEPQIAEGRGYGKNKYYTYNITKHKKGSITNGQSEYR